MVSKPYLQAMKRPFRRGRTLLRGLIYSPWLLTIYKSWDDPPSALGVRFWGFLLRNFPSPPPTPRCSGQVAAPSTPASARQVGQETLGLEKRPKGGDHESVSLLIFLLRRKKNPKMGFFHREIDGIFCVGSFFW